MKLLSKYHKQKLDKSRVKRYQKLIEDYKLPYNPKEELGYLYASIFELGLKNKEMFQSQFELIRNNNIDLWDNLSYQERNFIIKCDIISEKMKLKKFVYEGQNIYIPFLDRLLNHLYEEETAILELPQYFKLYDQFTNRIIPIGSYGFLPFETNMSFAKHIITQGSICILYDTVTSVFYKYDGAELKRYPILQSPNHDIGEINEIAKQLVTSEDAFIDLLIERELLNPKCIKKIAKYRSKGKDL